MSIFSTSTGCFCSEESPLSTRLAGERPGVGLARGLRVRRSRLGGRGVAAVTVVTAAAAGEHQAAGDQGRGEQAEGTGTNGTHAG